MSIQILITKQELRQLKKQLRRQREIVCLDEAAYLKTLLVGREMLMHGAPKIAEVKKGF